MELAELIEKLQDLDPDRVCRPGFQDPHSYRGYYDRLAFVPCEEAKVSEMLEAAKEANGSTYYGWKGGDFTMGDESFVHLAHEGCLGPRVTELLVRVMSGDALEDPDSARGYVEMGLSKAAIATFAAYGGVHGIDKAEDALNKFILENLKIDRS